MSTTASAVGIPQATPANHTFPLPYDPEKVLKLRRGDEIVIVKINPDDTTAIVSHLTLEEVSLS